MTALTRPIRRLLGREDRADEAAPALVEEPESRPAPGPAASASAPIAIDIPESDPLLAYLQTASGPVEIAKLELDSPAVRAMREAGVALVVPLVSQGERSSRRSC